MMAAVTANDPYHHAYSAALAARLRGYMREYEQAAVLAARALELSEKHQFPYPTACEGSIAEALETVEQALHANPEELLYRPETLRLRGELRLKQGHAEQAEADFHEAIALAQSMGARAWELRATISLARLLAKQGKRDEARAMLRDIYNWFTEGFDTADLKDAKALIDELSS